mmetsp:Transcript_16436/g.57432  ORF Transcript_16436/g.57432 Transcript_16436/m.57432 type:complete len:449 (+) Transcript_16436:1792-3138(+)
MQAHVRGGRARQRPHAAARASGLALQQLAQPSHLPPRAREQHRVVDDLVSAHVDHDLPRAIRERHRRGGLLGRRRGRRHGGNDDRPRVAAERVLQQPRQRRVSIRDVRASLLRQRLDAVAERRQRLVDRRQLLGAPGVQPSRRVPLLAARQVDEVELRAANHLAARAWLARLHRHIELQDRVAARRRLVVLGAAHGAVPPARLQQEQHVLRAAHAVLGQVLHVHLCLLALGLGGLTDDERPAPLSILQKVVQLLVVDLDVGAVHGVGGRAVVAELGEHVEEVVDGARDHAPLVAALHALPVARHERVLKAIAQHRVRLARPRLPVREDGGVHTHEAGADGGLHEVVQVLLRGLGAEGVIERRPHIAHDDAAAVVLHAHQRGVVVSVLAADGRSNAHDNMDALHDGGARAARAASGAASARRPRSLGSSQPDATTTHGSAGKRPPRVRP